MTGLYDCAIAESGSISCPEKLLRGVSVRPRHGVRSPISGACCLFACDGGDYSERPLCGEILRAGR